MLAPSAGLQTDWVDLYQVHRPDPKDRHRGDAGGAHRAGNIRAFGCSTFPAELIVEAYHVVTSTIIGPRTMEQLEATLAGAALALDDATLDRIDEIVPPGTELHVSSPWHADVLGNPAARRRPSAVCQARQ